MEYPFPDISEMNTDTIYAELNKHAENIKNMEAINDETAAIVKRSIALANEYKRRITSVKEQIVSMFEDNTTKTSNP